VFLSITFKEGHQSIVEEIVGDKVDAENLISEMASGNLSNVPFVEHFDYVFREGFVLRYEKSIVEDLTNNIALEGGATLRLDSYCSGIEIYATGGDRTSDAIPIDMEYIKKIENLYASWLEQGLVPAGWQLTMREIY